MKYGACLCSSILLMTILVFWQDSEAEQNNALAECRDQSADLNQLHACMNGYLDTIDENMRSIAGFLDQSLTGDARARLRRAQKVFIEYRRENCLWYTDSSSPGPVADQIAKNCLADMTRARVQELQDVVTANAQGTQTVEGFYLHTGGQDFFMHCGQTKRYYVDGEAGLLEQLQENYDAVASDDGQLLHAMLVGSLDSKVQSPRGYQGVLQLEAVIDLSVPSDKACSKNNKVSHSGISAIDVYVPDILREVFDDEVPPQEEPEQQLAAYFGDWIVDCVELRGQKSCKLEVNLIEGDNEPVTDQGALAPRLVVNRASKRSTFIQVVFPERVIQSPTLVSWQIDQTSLGDIVGSKISVDQFEARLLVNESEFLVDELMPLLRDGSRVVFSVQTSIDGSAGDIFAADLQGLSNSLVFVDDFLSDNS